MKRAVLLVLVGIASSCNGVPPAVIDAGTDDASLDGGDLDAGLADAGETDAGSIDAGITDAGSDAGLDAGADAGQPDAGAIDAGPDLCPVPSGVGAVFRVRAMAANLTSGSNQSYDPGEGARIMQGADPDIVMIQEFNFGNKTPADMDTFVARTFDGGVDGGFAYYRGVGNIPNGVISRWPIIAQGEWAGQSPDRNLTWVHVDIPGPNDLWVISVHLPTSSAGSRDMDARTIIRQLDAGIPEYDYLVLGGDLNTTNRSEAAFSTLSARFVVSGPYPADQFSNEGTNANRNKPYDNVLATPCLARRQQPSVVGTTAFAAGLVIDTRGYTPLTDLAPALQSDSAATNMQHMGVVKDFFIQP